MFLVCPLDMDVNVSHDRADVDRLPVHGNAAFAPRAAGKQPSAVCHHLRQRDGGDDHGARQPDDQQPEAAGHPHDAAAPGTGAARLVLYVFLYDRVHRSADRGAGPHQLLEVANEHHRRAVRAADVDQIHHAAEQRVGQHEAARRLLPHHDAARAAYLSRAAHGAPLHGRQDTAARAQGESARTSHAAHIRVHRRANILRHHLLRRVLRGGHVPVDTARLLVGDHHSDDGRVRRHVSQVGDGLPRRRHVRPDGHPRHRAAGAHHRQQLQPVLRTRAAQGRA